MNQMTGSCKLVRMVLMLAVMVVLAACASSGGESVYQQAAGVGNDPRTVERLVSQTEDLTVVDCLLPGRMRRMGRTITWVTRPRPVKQTATDCEILGGQYILFDRANPDTALALWMSAAETGDPTAQTYVGEIHERGIGRARDYAKAAKWYRKAAEQGFPRAQLLLGNLYESGNGVPKDPVKALDLYRKAAGLSQDKVVYLSEALAAARAAAPKSKGPDPRKARTQYQAIKAKRKTNDAQVRRTDAKVVQAKTDVMRSGRMVDQSTAAITTKRRLIDQYLAVSQVAESQRIERDSQQRIEVLAGPIVAQK